MYYCIVKLRYLVEISIFVSWKEISRFVNGSVYGCSLTQVRIQETSNEESRVYLAETIDGSLLSCGVGIVQCLLNLLCYVIW